jgi:hypothetical protein
LRHTVATRLLRRGASMKEIADVTPAYGGINYARLEHGSLQWPCPTEDHPGLQFLHEGMFSRGKGRFAALEVQSKSKGLGSDVTAETESGSISMRGVSGRLKTYDAYKLWLTVANPEKYLKAQKSG